MTAPTAVWIRYTPRSMWHTDSGDRAAGTPITDCRIAFQPAKTYEGGRPARGRVCRECWYKWDELHRQRSRYFPRWREEVPA